MAFEFVHLDASEQQDLIHFLLRSFGADPNLVSFRPEVMHWKYFADHPEWTRPRSFAIKKEGEIVAHGGVWPITLVTTQSTIKAIHLIDWAATRSAIGAGVQLLRRLAQDNEVLVTIGGSQDTRALLPKLGYKPCGELRRYARVVRPWLLFRTTPGKTWKAGINLVRNSSRALIRIPAVPKGWQVTKVSAFAGAVDDAVLGQTTSPTASRRTAAGLDRLLSCPAGRFSGFLVRREQLQGYFLIAQIGRQARIVDMGLNSNDQEPWQGICALAAATAAQPPETCEIVAASSNEAIGNAWLRAGFSHRRTDQIFCYAARNKVVISGPPLDLTLADGDLCFLSDPRVPYLS